MITMDGGFTLLKQNDRHMMNGRIRCNKIPFHAQQASKMKHIGVYVPVRSRKVRQEYDSKFIEEYHQKLVRECETKRTRSSRQKSFRGKTLKDRRRNACQKDMSACKYVGRDVAERKRARGLN